MHLDTFQRVITLTMKSHLITNYQLLKNLVMDGVQSSELGFRAASVLTFHLNTKLVIECIKNFLSILTQGSFLSDIHMFWMPTVLINLLVFTIQIPD